MKKLRDYAIVLGLAGMILMVSADTKDVKATGKISYESEGLSEGVCVTAGMKTAEASRTIQDEQPEAEQQLARTLEAVPEENLEADSPEEALQPGSLDEAGTDAAEEAASGWVYEVSGEDYDALLRLVEAEASGEDIKGKMLVANVVLNRAESGLFPDTIKEVIYQRQNGRAQFSPVATGKIDRVSVSEETVEAVERALCGEDESAGALYFVAPACADAENHAWFQRNLTLLFSYNGHEFYA